MPDDSALRSTLDELKSMQTQPEPARSKSPPTQHEPPGASSGSSLLADLLSESSGEAQRELERVKAQIQDRKALEIETKRVAEAERRQQLDGLRAQEARRREEMIAERERRRSVAAAPVVQETILDHVEPALPAPPPAKGHGALWGALAAVLVIGAAAGGWWYMDQKAETEAEKVRQAAAAQAAEKQAAQDAKLADHKKQLAASIAKKEEAEARARRSAAAAASARASATRADARGDAAKARPPAPAGPVAVAIADPSYRGAEGEARYTRKYLEMKAKRRRPGKKRAGGTTTRRGGIRIKALDLGRSK